MHRATGEEDDGVLVGRLGAKLWLLVRKAVVVLLVDLVESVSFRTLTSAAVTASSVKVL